MDNQEKLTILGYFKCVKCKKDTNHGLDTQGLLTCMVCKNKKSKAKPKKK